MPDCRTCFQTVTELARIRRHVPVINRTYKKKLFIECTDVLLMPIYNSKLKSNRVEGLPFLVRLLLSGRSHPETGVTKLCRSGLFVHEMARCLTL